MEDLAGLGQRLGQASSSRLLAVRVMSSPERQPTGIPGLYPSRAGIGDPRDGIFLIPPPACRASE